ncbi:MAG: 50S ribosomal protein L11 methyltransferase [Bacteroidetes bacterium]|nr:50S ribosomal protein L11 methyltransferase [Bacteroidota bacterium]MBU1580802.1 50S ribosomal protein L11 methyltransferase [Bacteroidota bacterium]MBU2466823.1 50S ribosomal protein L11 methyltransferase [Bacteroidota bacterium]MBU2558073.1 50S ribosomal protein L11 methyltransferase [Bacteroidota bacterium]
MAYIEVLFSLPANSNQQEMLAALLAESGFESFMEDETSFRAYCPEGSFNALEVEEIIDKAEFQEIKLLKKTLIPDENWNANWESSYEDVVIDGVCRIRAPFHQADQSIKYELLIEPRMSFGTAHHETTAQMISLMLKLDFYKKTVLDMGCGTAVLAVLASKMAAKKVVAIDNDQWAYENALDNVEVNDCEAVEVIKGDATAIGNQKFDIVLANINRNILLTDMPTYIDAMLPRANLLISGFYQEDLKDLKHLAEKSGLVFETHITKNNWVAAQFTKA